VIGVALVAGLVAVCGALIWLNRDPVEQRPNHIHTRKPR
jgi:hypothetical protein